MSLSSLNSIGQTVFELQTEKKCGRTDGWTDKRTRNGQTNGDGNQCPCQV